MRKFRIVTIGLLLLLIGVVAACSTPNNAEPQVVEVTREVEVIREVVVTREIIVEVEREAEAEAPASDEAAVAEAPTPTPEPTVAPTPFPTATPAVYGERGDFTEEDLAILYEVWGIIEEEYNGLLPTDDAVRDAIVDAAIATLGDRFADYYPADVVDFIDTQMRGDYQGIGAYVDTNEQGFFYIVRPIPGTPAEAAGLAPEDRVIGVDGMSVIGLSQDEIVALVRGPAGEPVVLTISRDGVDEPFDVTIVRARVEIPVVVAEMREDNIAYIQLSSFNQLARPQLEAAIQDLLDQGAEGMIFDLRYNGGGLLSSAIEVADLFLPESDLVIIRDNRGREDVLTIPNTGDVAEAIPMVVLINDASASASELLAAAFKDYERATLIGTSTFGKGSVQTIYTLSDGSEMKVTTARFFSPSDNIINDVGVEPDVFLDHTPEEVGGEDDRQLQRAIEFLMSGR